MIAVPGSYLRFFFIVYKKYGLWNLDDSFDPKNPLLPSSLSHNLESFSHDYGRNCEIERRAQRGANTIFFFTYQFLSRLLRFSKVKKKMVFVVSRSKINVTNWPINAMHARQYSQLPFAWFWEQFFPFARGVLTNNKMFFWWFYLHSSFDSKERSFQETHHHANCDRNGNELSNPRTMKMVTSIAWRKKNEPKRRRRVIPFSQIALLHAQEAKQSSRG